jgi:hypothetical protein
VVDAPVFDEMIFGDEIDLECQSQECQKCLKFLQRKHSSPLRGSADSECQELDTKVK